MCVSMIMHAYARLCVCVCINLNYAMKTLCKGILISNSSLLYTQSFQDLWYRGVGTREAGGALAPSHSRSRAQNHTCV